MLAPSSPPATPATLPAVSLAIPSIPHFQNIASCLSLPLDLATSSLRFPRCIISRRLFMPKNLAVERLSISDWVKNLSAIPAKDFTLENVQSYVIQYYVRSETLDKYLFFSKGCYTRNLIFKNDIFECMAICWEIGQFSRIHNHRDQNCWMSAPIGRLKVQNFRVEDRLSEADHRGTCKLVATDIYEMDAAHPAYVNPLEPVHQVQ